MKIIKFLLLASLLLLSQSTRAQRPELVVQTGHSAGVNSVAYAPDGGLLASGGKDGLVKVWHAATGSELRTLGGHKAQVSAVAFSPDGKLLASGSEDKTLKLWEVASGREVRALTGHAGAVSALAFSPDGGSIASGDQEGKVKTWAVQTGVETRTLEAHAGYVTALAFSPDGTLLASASGDRTLKLWDAVGGTTRLTIKSLQLPFRALAFSPDGKTIATGTQDNRLTLWNVADGAEGRTLMGNPGIINAVAFSPDGKYLLSGKHDGQIERWDLGAGQRLNIVANDGGDAINSLAFSPDGRTFSSAGDDKTVKLWDTALGREVATLKGRTRAVTSLSFDATGDLLAAASADGDVKLWRLGPTSDMRVLGEHDDVVSSVAFAPRGKVLASASAEGVIKLWDAATYKLTRTLRDGSSSVRSVAFGPDASVLASGGEAGVRLWDVATGTLRRSLDNDQPGPTYEVCFSPDGKILAAANHDGSLILWDVATGTKLRQWAAHEDGAAAVAVRFSPDGRTLASGGVDTTIKLWEPATGTLRQTLKGHTEGVNSIAFLRGGRQLLSGSADGMVKRWNVLSGKLEMSAGGHKGGVMAVAAGPRDSVASGSFDASIKLRPATLTQPGGELLAIDRADWVVLSPDGRFDGSPDGLRLVHYVQNNQPIPLDSLFEKLFTPKLLRELTEGRATASALPKSAAAPNGSGGFKKGAAIRPQPARPASSSEAYAPAATLKLDTSKPFAPPPLVKISTPDKTAQSAGPPGAPTDRTRGIGVENLEDARTPITIEITDQGGGLDSVRLYHNEKLFAEERLDAGATTEGGKVSKTFYVALAPGVNEFAATALNRERTESQPARTRVEVASMQPVVNLYIVSVGLNQYQNAKYNLNYGRTDADSFAREIEKRARGIFKQVDKQVIFDTQATRAGIEAAFERVAAAAQPQDAFVFYFAGHGVMSEGDAQTPADFHLVPYDVTQLYGDDRQLSLKAISARRLKELCTKVRAQKQLIVFDACQSGGAVEAFATYRGASEEKAILQLARSAGVVVLAASGTEQLAAEFPKLGHGVFTYALLQGLSGEADGGAQPDGKITVKELEAFLNDMVPELSRRYRGKPQYPNSYARGQDFPISIK